MKDYTGLNFIELKLLPLSLYLLYRRDSWINYMMETEKGREFLKDVKRLQETKADVQAIREFNERRK